MRIYIGAWNLLPPVIEARAEWIAAATEKQIEAEVNRQSGLLLSSKETKGNDMDSYSKENLVGVFTPEEFCATFNEDLKGAFNTKDYFVKIFDEPRPGKLHIATLVERYDYQVAIRATIHAATGPKLAADVIKFLDTEFDPCDELSSNVNYDAKKILMECTEGNSGGNPLTIEFEGEDDHELFLSVHVIDDIPEKLRETFKWICKNIHIPWESFGKEQPVFGDLMDFLRDTFGAPKDLALGYMLLGDRASEPHIQWDGTPSKAGFDELLTETHAIMRAHDKKCTLKYDEDPKELSFELIRTDEKSVMPDIRTLDARECLAFAESILEEEKGELPL